MKQKLRFKKDGFNQFGWQCSRPENLVIGKNVDIAKGCVLFAHNGIEIGDDVMIGPNCTILSDSSIDNKHKKVVINSGARIGANSVVMPGVTIGEDALIGAMSFVNRDVRDGDRVWGIPARLQ